jgi:hypothetical protein
VSAVITKLPTAAPSYIQVRRYGRQWCISLVTPCEGGKPISTKLGSHPREVGAVDYARHIGARMQRPVRLPGERAP